MNKMIAKNRTSCFSVMKVTVLELLTATGIPIKDLLLVPLNRIIVCMCGKLKNKCIIKINDILKKVFSYSIEDND